MGANGGFDRIILLVYVGTVVGGRGLWEGRVYGRGLYGGVGGSHSINVYGWTR